MKRTTGLLRRLATQIYGNFGEPFLPERGFRAFWRSLWCEHDWEVLKSERITPELFKVDAVCKHCRLRIDGGLMKVGL